MAAIASLEHDLMREEMTLVEQLDVRREGRGGRQSLHPVSSTTLQEIIKDFERNYTDMVGSFLESVQAQYPSCTYTVFTCTYIIYTVFRLSILHIQAQYTTR